MATPHEKYMQFLPAADLPLNINVYEVITCIHQLYAISWVATLTHIERQKPLLHRNIASLLRLTAAEM